MPDHTVKAFDADLARLARMIAEMHEQVERELKDAVEAFIRNDNKLVKAVLDLDESNAAMNRDIETNVILLIARRQPVGYDLRFVIAIWETTIELDRVSGIARSIVNRANAFGSVYSKPHLAQGLRRITRAALCRLRIVVNSLVISDAARAEALSVPDDGIDSTYSSLCRELLTYMMADPSASPSVIQLLFSAKSIESIGDNATNISDAVYYLAQGQRPSRAVGSLLGRPISTERTS